MHWSMRAFGILAALVAFFLVGSAGGESDRRTFSRITHRRVFPRAASVYAELPSAANSYEALLAPLWPGLSLRLLPLRHVEVRNGIFAYSVQLLSEELDGQPVLPTNQPGHGISADVVAAFHFRNRENSAPNAAGPLNLNAPGEFRIVRYPGVTLEIRILAFEILNARPGVVPSFSALALLITAREEVNDAADPLQKSR